MIPETFFIYHAYITHAVVRFEMKFWVQLNRNKRQSGRKRNFLVPINCWKLEHSK